MPRFIMTLTAIIDAPVAPTDAARKAMAKGFSRGVDQAGWKCEAANVEVDPA